MNGEAAAAFVRDHTRLLRPAGVPELRLHLAEDPFWLWRRTEEQAGHPGLPPPYWAFAWPGGQALARYLLDDPELVRGRRVLDVGSGSGLVAIAAARAGAASVVATDVDALAVAAVSLNAEANDVSVVSLLADGLRGEGSGVDLVLAGDLFYERPMAERVLAFLEAAHASGAGVLVGDPGREYLPQTRFEPLASYEVAVPAGLEDRAVKLTTVWQPARG